MSAKGIENPFFLVTFGLIETTWNDYNTTEQETYVCTLSARCAIDKEVANRTRVT